MIEDAEDEGLYLMMSMVRMSLKMMWVCVHLPLSAQGHSDKEDDAIDEDEDESFAVVKLAENEADEIEDDIFDIKVWEDDDAIVGVQLDGFAVRNVREGVVSEDLQDEPDELDGLDGIQVDQKDAQ